MSTGKFVLITGATGHVGFKTLLVLLQAGYRARIAVRSTTKGNIITENPAFKSYGFSPSSYEFAVVPDIAAKGAYDAAVKGVDYIIHIASPLTGGEMSTTEEYHKHFIEPAVSSTLNILDAAKAEANIKRIVNTSSVNALLPYRDAARSHTADEWFNAENRASNDDGPYNLGNMHAYSASKIAALNASEQWVKSNKPHFDVVSIHPSFCMGRNDLDLAPESMFIPGPHMFLLIPAVGNEFPFPLSASTVHNDDVARLHVEALNTSIPPGSYIANGPEARWEMVPAIIKKRFPQAIENGTLSEQGKMISLASQYDARKTEETFGWKFQDFEAQVEDVVAHYLELVERAKAA